MSNLTRHLKIHEVKTLGEGEKDIMAAFDVLRLDSQVQYVF